MTPLPPSPAEGEGRYETAGPRLARILFGWDGPMWRYRTPTWGAWQQGEPPPGPRYLGSTDA